MDWHDIQGWFDFSDLYDEQVRSALDGAHFVEVGSWLGKSTAYMAQAIKQSGKQIAFDAVDNWRGGTDSPVNHHVIIDTVTECGGDVLPVFTANLKSRGLQDFVRPIRDDSTLAAERYSAESVDFVFIDADHAYERVKADIAAWWPKVKSGSVLAGHDFNEEGPQRAATEFAEANRLPLVKMGRCFAIRKPACPRAKILIGFPTHGFATAKSAIAAASNQSNRHDVEVAVRESSLLAHGFNQLWAEALDGDFTHFAMLHADIVPQRWWVDLLLEEQRAAGVDMLGVVSPIKDYRGVTSIGIAADDLAEWWAPKKRFTMQEVCRMPFTFTAADAGYPGEMLMLNTGCWIADLRNPAWKEKDAAGDFLVYFQIRNRLWEHEGKILAGVQSEDWFFSIRAQLAGLQLAATRKVELQHFGPFGWPNNVPWGKWDVDRKTDSYSEHIPQLSSS